MRGLQLPLQRTLASFAVGSWSVVILGASAASKPPLPPARQQHYDPDPAVCQPALLQSSFRQQLLPWADQPAPVLARLSQLQLEMLRATLQRCVSKGLLSPQQAESVQNSLIPLPTAPVQPSAARP